MERVVPALKQSQMSVQEGKEAMELPAIWTCNLSRIDVVNTIIIYTYISVQEPRKYPKDSH